MSDNGGVMQIEYVDVDLSSLTDADGEPFDPTVETGIDRPEGVAVVGYDGAGTYVAQYDDAAQKIVVAAIADGTEPGAGTDAGSATVRVEGRS